MDARPKRAATVDELRDVAREIVRFVEQRRRRLAVSHAVLDNERDEPANDREPKRTMH